MASAKLLLILFLIATPAHAGNIGEGNLGSVEQIVEESITTVQDTLNKKKCRAYFDRLPDNVPEWTAVVQGYPYPRELPPAAWVKCDTPDKIYINEDYVGWLWDRHFVEHLLVHELAHLASCSTKGLLEEEWQAISYQAERACFGHIREDLDREWKD